MSDVESNPLWYRVANLKVELRDHVSIHRHQYRSKIWYVVQDSISNKHYRFGQDAYRLMCQFDGCLSVEQVCQHLKTTNQTVPSQNEVIGLLSSLYSNDLIHSDVTPDTTEILQRFEKHNGPHWKKYVKGPLLIRLPLLDPNRALNKFQMLARILFSRGSYFIGASVLLFAAILCASYSSDISEYWNQRALAPYNLLLLVLCYPFVKALHEFAHALAVKRWGGEVHEMGIMFLIFMPLPYVDASSSSVFPDKRQRMMVSAAGILTELFLAAIASFIWFSVETGIVRDLAYNIMLIGGISTLLFNGNPLLRFDGYYVLADAIEIPNLAQRSTRYYSYLVQRYLFKINNAQTPVTELGERPWLLAYGTASTLYRLIILVTIVLFLFEEYLLFGLILGTVAVLLQVVLPITKQIQFLLKNPSLKHKRVRAISTSLLLIGITLFAVFVIPLPASTYTQGVVWLPEHAQIRTSADGFIENILQKPQSQVSSGTALIETRNSLLNIEVERNQWKLKELKARLDEKVMSDRVEAGMLSEEIERITEDLIEAQKKVANLIVTSPADGTFLLSKAHHISGRFAHKGDVLGYVTDLSQPTIRAVVKQTDIGLVRNNTTAVQIKLADNTEKTLSAHIIRQIPSATATLPDKSLGTLGGGLITVDPKDSNGVTTMEDIFLLDIGLPDDLSVERVGTRAHIRFKHESQPLAKRIYRGIRQVFLKRFTV